MLFEVIEAKPRYDGHETILAKIAGYRYMPYVVWMRRRDDGSVHWGQYCRSLDEAWEAYQARA